MTNFDINEDSLAIALGLSKNSSEEARTKTTPSNLDLLQENEAGDTAQAQNNKNAFATSGLNRILFVSGAAAFVIIVLVSFFGSAFGLGGNKVTKVTAPAEEEISELETSEAEVADAEATTRLYLYKQEQDLKAIDQIPVENETESVDPKLLPEAKTISAQPAPVPIVKPAPPRSIASAFVPTLQSVPSFTKTNSTIKSAPAPIKYDSLATWEALSQINSTGSVSGLKSKTIVSSRIKEVNYLDFRKKVINNPLKISKA